MLWMHAIIALLVSGAMDFGHESLGKHANDGSWREHLHLFFTERLRVRVAGK